MLRSLFTAGIAASLSLAAAQTTYTYSFDPENAAGIDGAILVTYDGQEPSDYDEAPTNKVTIKAALDFSNADMSSLQDGDDDCPAEITEYKWHIHTKWSSNKTSASFDGCSLANVGNHFDPTFACGPNSEHNKDEECENAKGDYSCSPVNYLKDLTSCEQGDLSGKLGSFKLDNDSLVIEEWTDPFFPAESSQTDGWNIVVHASCNGSAPRVACANIREVDVKTEYTEESGSMDSSSSDKSVSVGDTSGSEESGSMEDNTSVEAGSSE